MRKLSKLHHKSEGEQKLLDLVAIINNHFTVRQEMF